MTQSIKRLISFYSGSFLAVSRGNKAYYTWLAVLLIAIVQGAIAYLAQLETGLIVTNLRDPVSWGLYIGNFTFLVGVAAAAIMLVIPGYVYKWRPMKEIVLFGELLAVAAVFMCILFVTIDIGRPDRIWHLTPFIGRLHFPSSLLAWDILVLTIYLVINAVVATHILNRSYHGRPYNTRLVAVLVLVSIPMAVGIHTVTAFLFNGLVARPYWNTALLAPRFLASAFCSGPAILLVLFQILRKVSTFRIRDEAIHKMAELMAYAMAINLFFLGAEIYKEYYSNAEHLIYFKYLFGTSDYAGSPLAPYAWASVITAVVAFALFIVPATRRNPLTMTAGCILIFSSVFLEKGIVLVIPGFTPDTLGQFYRYAPSLIEFRVSIGVLGAGFLAYTVMVKVASAIVFDQFTAPGVHTASPAVAGHPANGHTP